MKLYNLITFVFWSFKASRAWSDICQPRSPALQIASTSRQYRWWGFYHPNYGCRAYTAVQMQSWDSGLWQVAKHQSSRCHTSRHLLIDNLAADQEYGKWGEYWWIFIVCSVFLPMGLSFAETKLGDEELLMGKVRMSMLCVRWDKDDICYRYDVSLPPVTHPFL